MEQMIFPMLSQFMTPDTVRSIADGIGEVLDSNHAIYIEVTRLEDDNPVTDSMTTAGFLQLVFTTMLEEINVSSNLDSALFGNADASTHTPAPVPLSGWVSGPNPSEEE